MKVVAADAQPKPLTIKEAVKSALENYGTIKAKANYVSASKASLLGTRREALPDLNISAQQDYGTINGQSGPLYGFRGLSASSGGPALETQNWASAFGALYLANINWDFFSFGRVKEKINAARSALIRDENDLEQEKFQHQVRVAAAYLNLLAAQRLTQSQKNNLERASRLRNVVVARTKNGLNAGVDSSQANAEVSAAKISLVRSRDYEQEQANQLAQFMGIVAQDFTLDSLFISRLPGAIYDTNLQSPANNPVLKYYQSLVDVSDQQAKYLRTFNYPTFSLFGVIQTRGSGFDYNYGIQFPKAYSTGYWSGTKPERSNYLTGVGVIWNLTTPLRIQQQLLSQKYTSLALKDQFNQAEQQYQNDLLLAANKIKNAMENYVEAPIQVKAASDAYLQKSVLYKNGLSNIVDITQALYTLNRAETDRDIAFSNVWQALLLKAAASGDFGLFINEF
ncbi:MAG: TolC family protein [Chitinophagaceae bacterium]